MEPVDLQVLADADRWLDEGRDAVLVTVVRTWGSSPRPPGALMALRADGRVSGSVSGGCIEDDLIAKAAEQGLDALAPAGRPRVLTYGISADEAHRFGLPCGGTLELVVERLGPDSRVAELRSRLQRRRLTRRTVDLRTGRTDLGDADRLEEIRRVDGKLTQVLGPGYRMLVIGAGQLSQYLCQTAIGLGFDVTVCDPRVEYTEGWSVPGVTLVRDMPDDAVLAMRPDERTAIVALTHDPKLDDLALLEALESPAFYVGALGSRVNNTRRRERLQEHFGIGDAAIARLHGPAGLYIGSRTPPEIALSILAEVVAVKNGVARRDMPAVGEVKDRLLSRSAACSRS